MSRFNGKKIALIGLKGEKGEPGEGLRILDTPPDISTVGYVGEIVQVADGTAYQCTAFTDGVTTWVKLIKETDIAVNNSGEYGLVKLGASSNGISRDGNGNLTVYGAQQTNLDRQVGGYTAVVSARLGYAVKQGLINPDLSTMLPANWTDEDRARAQATLGINGGTKLYLHTLTFTHLANTNCTTTVRVISTSSALISNNPDTYMLNNYEYVIGIKQERLDVWNMDCSYQMRVTLITRQIKVLPC